MQFTGELTLGAIGIIASILGSSLAGITTLLTVYMRTRGDITSLQIGHSDLKSDMTEIKAELKVMGANMQTNHIMLERVAARQEMLGAINNLPNDLATAIGKIYRKDVA